MKIFQAALSALAVTKASANAVQCNIESIIVVDCSAETGFRVSKSNSSITFTLLQIDLDNGDASSGACYDFLTAGTWNMHLFADGITASNSQCNAGTVSETMFDLSAAVIDSDCVDTTNPAGSLDFSTNIYFYDNDGNRPWSSVS